MSGYTFWTDGYFAYSVGNVSEEMLKRYIVVTIRMWSNEA